MNPDEWPLPIRILFVLFVSVIAWTAIGVMAEAARILFGWCGY